MRKIIFLDVDGVLNSLPYHNAHKNDPDYQELNHENLNRLSIIQRLTQAELVLASTWKALNAPDEPEAYKMWLYLVDTLKKYDLEIMDSTPESEKGRPCDIRQWLDAHPDEEIRYAILDDDYHEKDYAEYGLGGHLVQTRYFCMLESQGGIQESHVKQTLKLLNGE